MKRASFVVAFGCSVLAVGCREKPAPGEDAERRLPAATSAPAVSSVPVAPSASAAARPVRPSEPLNVFLVTIDSLRTDVSFQGYSRPNTPNLERVARESVVYTNAYAASSYTAKSVATMISGRYASTLYRDGYFFTKYPAANLFLSEILGERGIKSIGWHAHLYFGRGKGLEQGFSEWQLVPGIGFDSETDNYVTSDKMTALGMQLLAKQELTGGRFFAWAHYMDPHDQYKKHAESPDFGNKGRDRYDSEIWYTDHHLGKLLDWAKTQPWWDKTALIVTADHGEAFGEHAMYKHAFELWEVLIRVPWLIHAPGVTPRRIERRRSHIDLAPTMLDLLGVPAPEGFQGRSLVAELYGGEPDDREPILSELAEDSHNPPRRALIAGDYKIIDFGRSRFELYDIARDPGEQTNLAKERADELARMRKLLDEKYAALPTVAPYGGMTLKEGGTARGPVGPAKSP